MCGYSKSQCGFGCYPVSVAQIIGTQLYNNCSQHSKKTAFLYNNTKYSCAIEDMEAISFEELFIIKCPEYKMDYKSWLNFNLFE